MQRLYSLILLSNINCKIKMRYETLPINVFALVVGESGKGKTRLNNLYKSLILPALEENKSFNFEKLPFFTKEREDYKKFGNIDLFYKSMNDPSLLKLLRILDIEKEGAVNLIIDEFATSFSRDFKFLSTSCLEIFDSGYLNNNLRVTSTVAKAKRQIGFNLIGLTTLENLDFKKFKSLLLQGFARRCLFFNIKEQNLKDLNYTELEVIEKQIMYIDIAKKYKNIEFTISKDVQEILGKG